MESGRRCMVFKDLTRTEHETIFVPFIYGCALVELDLEGVHTFFLFCCNINMFHYRVHMKKVGMSQIGTNIHFKWRSTNIYAILFFYLICVVILHF